MHRVRSLAGSGVTKCKNSRHFANKVTRRASIAAAAAALTLLQLPNLLHGQTRHPRPGVEPSGTLQGTVTLACPQDAIGCENQLYKVGLFIWSDRNGLPPMQVYASPGFTVSLAPGTYTIASADVRGACCLPTLQPVTVTVVSDRTTHVDLRFERGLQLPTR
jgi:hypothetical protein